MSAPESMLATKGQILKASAITLVVAGVALVTLVLPAEYGVDPLGTGRALGLTAIADPQEGLPIASTEVGFEYVPAIQGAAAAYAGAYKTETYTFTLGPYEWIEYKYQMEKGASMVFSWAASEAVTHDFHSEPDVKGSAEVISYDKRRLRGSNGSLAAPFTGIHGWYWENTTGSPVTVKVSAAGFFAGGLELRSDRTSKVHELSAVQAVNP
jgi:hypothetical protein